MKFNTVQDLLNWNAAEGGNSQDPQESPWEKSYRDSMARSIVKNINDKKDPQLTLEVAKYLLGTLVSWHKKVLEAKRKENADDVYIWAYDYAKLNASLEALNDVEAGSHS